MGHGRSNIENISVVIMKEGLETRSPCCPFPHLSSKTPIIDSLHPLFLYKYSVDENPPNGSKGPLELPCIVFYTYFSISSEGRGRDLSADRPEECVRL